MKGVLHCIIITKSQYSILNSQYMFVIQKSHIFAPVFKKIYMSTLRSKGKIVQIIGPVIDVRFEGTSLPNILDALEVTRPDGQKVILECEQHTGQDTVRTIAMDSTDGLRRGVDVFCLGGPIKMPIGDKIKGRLFNVVGE